MVALAGLAKKGEGLLCWSQRAALQASSNAALAECLQHVFEMKKDACLSVSVHIKPWVVSLLLSGHGAKCNGFAMWVVIE